MPISSNRFVEITSKVVGASLVKERQLVLRVYTTNKLVPANAVICADSIDSVGLYLGTDCAEYKLAQYYFGFISKGARKPKMIQFARYANKSITANAYSKHLSANDINAMKAVKGGEFKIQVGSKVVEVKNLDFSSATSFAAVATALQTALQSAQDSSKSSPFSGSSVTYDMETGRLFIDTKVSGNNQFILTDGEKEPLSALGFKAPTSVISDGTDAQSVTDTLTNTVRVNNNFGSYTFLSDTFTKDNVFDAGKFADTANVNFIYAVKVGKKNYSDIQNVLSKLSSCCMTYCNDDITDKAGKVTYTDYAYLLPSCVMASQNFNDVNATENYMFQIDNRLTPSVSDDVTAKTFDTLKINYYGQTQENGHYISFYETGCLTGGNSGINFISIHVNEQWLRSEIKDQLLNMFLALKEISADKAGVLVASSYLSAVATKAQRNGVFSQGATLSTTNIAKITELSGDPKAFHDVGSKGYWFKIVVDREKNELDYTLIYAKRDDINHISGTHELI